MEAEPEPEAEEAWQGTVVGETAEPVRMEEEVVPVEAEAESELVVAGEVVPEIVEGEEGVATEPVIASETMARDAPEEGAADEPRGWLSSLFGARRESGAEADAEASKSEIEQAAGEAVPEVMEREAPSEGWRADVALGLTRGSVEATGKGKNRPPSPAPADLRLVSTDDSDRLLSTDDISGDYRGSCFGSLCTSMIVVPLGADLIEVKKSYWFCLPPLFVGPYGDGDVWIRNPNTNVFYRKRYGHGAKDGSDVVTFSADGTATAKLCFQNSYQKKAVSQKRTFQKVDTGDLAGTWCSCMYYPVVPLFFCTTGCLCTTKKALDEDRYEESGCGCSLVPPFIVLPRRDDPGRAGPYTRTRFYANGHPTNGFYAGINMLGGDAQQNFIRWYSDASYGSGGMGVFSKKLC